MRVIYPGTFDPVTNGHLDMIKRASLAFDEVIVAVLDNISKSPLFSTEERVSLLKQTCKDFPNVEVEHFSGLLVEFAESKNTYTILRGLRAVSDYENEMKNALANRQLNENIETLFMVSKSEYTFLSSSLVKEIASFHGDVSKMAPLEVIKALEEKYK